jgi:exopolysaccharide production protein ExoQ
LYTLTGRIDIWRECVPYLDKHPIIGFGYGSFWTPDRLFFFKENRGLATAHSAYLEVALDLGIVGLVTYILILVMAVKTSIFHYMRSASIEYAFTSAVLLAYSLRLITESAAPLSQVPSFLCLILLARLGFIKKPTRSHEKM